MNFDMNLIDSFSKLLIIGIIIGSISLLYDKISKIIKDSKLHLSSEFNKIWKEIGLADYKIVKHNKMRNKSEFIVKVPSGKSFKDINEKKDVKGIIEKAYKCKCEIENIDYSNCVKIVMEFNK